MFKTKFGSVTCPQCKEKQWSIVDCRYVKLFGHCWAEDKTAWLNGKLSAIEFEARETKAAETDI